MDVISLLFVYLMEKMLLFILKIVKDKNPFFEML